VVRAIGGGAEAVRVVMGGDGGAVAPDSGLASTVVMSPVELGFGGVDFGGGDLLPTRLDVVGWPDDG
jgi:hypothetical protein